MIRKTRKKKAAAVSIIGGADGPTSVFIAGKKKYGKDMPLGKGQRQRQLSKQNPIALTSWYFICKINTMRLSCQNRVFLIRNNINV